MQNGLATDYLVDLVPPRIGNETPYSLPNADNYQQVHAISRLYFDSCLPSTIREWNSLPVDVKSAQTLTSFKYKESGTPKFPKYYIFCDRQSDTSFKSSLRWLSWMRRPTGDQDVAGSTPAEVGSILSWRLIMKYFLRSFSPFRGFQKGSCQFLAKECAQYWLTA